MSDNAAIIAAHLNTLKSRASSVKDDAEAALSTLQTAAKSFLTLSTPALDFTLPSVALSTEATEITATLDSGLQYPDAASALVAAIADGYDSDFLQFLEASARNTPLAAWSVAILAVRDSYRAGVTAQADTFVRTYLPVPAAYVAAYAAAGAAMVADTQARHDADSTLKWGAFLNDTLVQVLQEQVTAGLSIEEVRARSVLELSGAFDDYNRALLEKGRTDFEAVLATVTQIRKQIDLRISQQVLVAEQDFTLSAMESKKELLVLDQYLAESSDTIRRVTADFAFDFDRSAALVAYMKTALAQAQLSAGSFTVNTSTSEG
jgi:hypothetical protein